MNLAVLTGRLTRDPDYRVSGETAVANYTLAVDRYGEGADFIRCVCFRKNADFARNYLFKGTKILVEGSIQTGSYEKDGVKRDTFSVIVNRHEFCEKKQAKPEGTAPVDDSFVEVESWDDLPFN